MPLNCCVPLCKSKKTKGSYYPKGVSFHEFPCNISVRNEWIRTICRKDECSGKLWTPSQYSVVCSLHFSDNCFKLNLKRRCLIPGSIPTIFPGYPSYLKVQQPPKKRRIVKDVIPDPKTNDCWCPKYSHCVCGLNFAPEQYKIDKRRKILLTESVTCIFPEENPEEANSNVDSITEANVELSYSGSSFNEGKNSECNSETIINEGKNSEGNSETIINEDPNIIGVLQSLGLHPIEILGSTTNSADQLHVKNMHTYASHRPVSVDDSLQKNSKIPITGTILNVNSSSHNISSSGQNISPSVERPGFNNDNFMYPITIEEGGSSVKENCIMPSRIDKNTIRSNILGNAEEKKLKTQLESAKRQNRRYKAQLLKLRNENKKYHLMNKILTEKFKGYNIEKLEKGIDSKDAKALFLFDQLRSLTKERILWSQSTMEFVNSFEKKFPKSYSFLREKNIINLPCRKILRFDLEEGDIESDSNS